MSLAPEEAADLVLRAADGDRGAWNGLVDAYGGLVWSVARRYRLTESDVADVSQVTWLRLVEHIDRLTEPSRVGAWLTTTAKREALRAQRQPQQRRTVLTADERLLELGAPVTDELDSALLQAEQAESVAWAVAQLPERLQELLRLLMQEPQPSYEEISRILDMPIGSIGPTRGRCMKKLERLLASREAPAPPAPLGPPLASGDRPRRVSQRRSAVPEPR